VAATLRARLIAGQVALLAMVCIGIAGATEFALYRYLVGDLDGQLRQIAQRSSMMR
jgi:two-component system OmpR family sensor kinase